MKVGSFILIILISQFTFAQQSVDDSLRKENKTTNKKDTLCYSLYIKSIFIDNRLYNSSDTSIFEISSNIPETFDKWVFQFRQDKVSYLKNNYILQINIKRIDYPSSNLMRAQDISVWVKPKHQTSSVMGIYSFSNQLDLGYFKNGVNYIIDTLVYKCSDNYFNTKEMNKYIVNDTCHVKSFHIIRGTPFVYQNRNKIDSILNNIITILKANKKLAELNKGRKIETKQQKYSCSDTITTSISLSLSKYKWKDYSFDEVGNIRQITISERRRKYFYKTCGFNEKDSYRCEYHFVGRVIKRVVVEE